MAPVLSFVSARIDPARLDAVRTPLEAAIAAGLPPGIAATYLLRAGDGTIAIATLWRDRADLEAMRSTTDEPLARRLLREAGGEPTAEFFEVLVSS